MSFAAEDSVAVWRSAWLRGGQILEIVWVGQEVLAWRSGLHIVFLNLLDGKLKFCKFSENAVAHGVSSLAGHFGLNIFAFAEKNSKPRILVYEYPALKRIAECAKGAAHAYVAMAFADDYLVSLGSLPDFKISIWLWRSGLKIASVETKINDAGHCAQSLRVNFFTPVFVAQIGNRSGRLSTWQLTICSKVAIFNENKIELPKKALVKDASWCPNLSITHGQDTLAIVDYEGHIYLCRPNGELLKRVVLSQRCSFCLEIEPTAICWHRGGLVLRTAFCQLRYYSQDEQGAWRKSWMFKSEHYVTALAGHPFRSDRLFYTSKDGQVVQIKLAEDNTDAELEVKYVNGGMYQFVGLVRPWEEHVVAIDESKELAVIRVEEGALVANFRLNLEGKVTAMLSHAENPLIVVSSDAGEVVFVSLLAYHEPLLLGKYKVHSETLDLMKFSSSGRYLVVSQKDEGICYLLTVSHTQRIEILTRLETSTKIVDVLLFDAQSTVQFYVLENSIRILCVGKKLILYTFLKNQFHRAPSVFYFKNLFKHLHYTFRESNAFVGTPYRSKRLSYFKIGDDANIYQYQLKINGHNVREVKISTNKKWLVTAGIDGFSVIRSSNLKSSHSVSFESHHRKDYGTTRAISNNYGDLMIALGADGSLVAMRPLEKWQKVQPNSQNMWEFGHSSFQDHNTKVAEYSSVLSEKLKEFLTDPAIAFARYEDSDNTTWVQWIEQRRIAEERKRHHAEKEKLLSSLLTLKAKVGELLDRNERATELDRLPVTSFDLNKRYRDRRTKAAKDQREDVKHQVEIDCLERERVAVWIQTKYWEPQRVLAQSIYGMFDETEVTNYAVSEDMVVNREFNDFATFERHIAAEITSHDCIDPWEVYTPAELRDMFEKQIRVKRADDIEKIDTLIDNAEEKIEATEEKQNYRQLLEGMTTHHFIEPCARYFSQYRIYAFGQIISDNRYVVEDCRRLRLYFNQLFDEVQSMKQREMALAHERIDRILHTSSELWLLFQEVVGKTFDYYPQWRPREKPETIIHVLDSEIFAKLYVSPSQQELIDRQAAEEERQHLALLADDFRARSLQRMMDGMLEVKWEDLLKRVPEPPECVALGKSPDAYTDDEALAVSRYEQQLRNLDAERAKYRRILQTDYAKTSEILVDGIEKFNTRLHELHWLKLKVEAAIQQLNLRYMRTLVTHLQRVDDIRWDDSVKETIKKKQRYMTRLTEDVKVFQGVEQELSAQYDTLSAKDKNLEKKLKYDFPTLGKHALSAITLHYKRRPRIVLKTKFPAELLDLGKSIVSMEKPSYLTAECSEYFKQMGALDVFPTTLPAAIDATHWKNLVALRRIKIDHEFKQRAVWLELQFASNSLAACHQTLSQCKLDCDTLTEELRRERNERCERELNVGLQLVLKLGQTELDHSQTGDVRHDSASALFITRTEIDKVNEAIRDMGRRKLKAMQRSIEFRRGISQEVWAHEVNQTSLNHVRTDLYYVRQAHVTREMARVLSKKKKDQSIQKMDRNFAVTRATAEKILNDWKTKLENVVEEISRVRRKNGKMDQDIIKMNVERCEMELNRDTVGEARQKNYQERVLKLIVEREAVVRKLLSNYEELVEMRARQEDAARGRGEPHKIFDDSFIIEE